LDLAGDYVDFKTGDLFHFDGKHQWDFKPWEYIILVKQMG